MTRNQIGITVGTVGFLVCIGAFVVSPYLESPATRLRRDALLAGRLLLVVASILVSSVFALEASGRQAAQSWISQPRWRRPSIVGAGLYTLGGFLRRDLEFGRFGVWAVARRVPLW
jgi:hypothetical protein